MQTIDGEDVSGASTTDDIFLGGQLTVRQPAHGYRAGTDAVLLAAAIPEADGPLLDAGAGVGTVGLCVAARIPQAHILLVERQPLLAALARVNIERNGFVGRLRVVEADISRPSPALAESGVASESFAHVFANPPFHDTGHGTKSPSDVKAASHQMQSDDLETWARFLTRMARPGGRMTMIHKAEALPRILAVLDGRFGALSIVPVLPRSDAEAVRVIVSGIKGSKAPLKLRPPLILHTAGQAFRPEIEAVFRHGAALPI